MIFLLDTNAVSDIVREHPTVRRHLGNIGPDDQAMICTIVRGEVLYGVERLPDGRRKSDLLAKVMVVLASVPCVPMPPAMGDRYSRLRVEQESRGAPLNDNDLWIAAATLELGATLVTRDKDFSRIEGLQVVAWTV